MYCLPSLIFIGLSIIALVLSVQAGLTSMGMVIIELLTTWLFALFIDYLCRNGYTIASWIIVLFPLTFMFALASGSMTNAASISPASY